MKILDPKGLSKKWKPQVRNNENLRPKKDYQRTENHKCIEKTTRNKSLETADAKNTPKKSKSYNDTHLLEIRVQHIQ